MEVILSAAFGTLSEAQTNPNDKVTTYAKKAMYPKPWPYIALMVPFIGKKLAKSIMFSRFGFNWQPLINIAKKILNQRREVEGITRNVCSICSNLICSILFLLEIKGLNKFCTMYRQGCRSTWTKKVHGCIPLALPLPL